MPGCAVRLTCPWLSRPRHIVSIARRPLDGVAGRQSFAGLIKDQAGEEAWLFRIRSGGAIDPIVVEDRPEPGPTGPRQQLADAPPGMHSPCV